MGTATVTTERLDELATACQGGKNVALDSRELCEIIRRSGTNSEAFLLALSKLEGHTFDDPVAVQGKDLAELINAIAD